MKIEEAKALIEEREQLLSRLEMFDPTKGDIEGDDSGSATPSKPSVRVAVPTGNNGWGDNFKAYPVPANEAEQIRQLSIGAWRDRVRTIEGVFDDHGINI